MRRFAAAIAWLAVASALGVVIAQATQTGQPGSWSAQGIHSGRNDPDSPQVDIYVSPFSDSFAEIRQIRWTEGASASFILNVWGPLGPLTIGMGFANGGELLWSTTSDALAITKSDAGIVGTYRVVAVWSREDQVNALDISSLVYPVFGDAGECDTPERPNVAAITWLGEARILVAAQVPNYSSCRKMGAFKLLDIDLEQMRVVATYGQQEGVLKFRDRLGPLLLKLHANCEKNEQFCL